MQGLWFLSQAGGAVGAAYNMVAVLRLSGTPDLDRLARALRRVQVRHQALRCTFQSAAGLPEMTVLDPASAPAWHLERAEGALEAVAAEAAARPLSLDAAPLARAVWVEPPAADAPRGLVLVLPHLTFDDASVQILIDDLSQAYDGADDAGPMPEPALTLVAAMARETAFATSGEAEELLQAAVERLAGVPAQLALPLADNALLPSGGDDGEALAFTLPPTLVARQREVARQLRVTAAAMDLAAWMVVLWRFSGQLDFGIAMPISHRADEASRHTIGYLTNLAVVRARIRPRETVTAWLTRVMDQQWDVMEGARLPFPLLTKRLKRMTTDLQGPLSQVGFNHVLAAPGQGRFAGFDMDRVEVTPRHLKNQLKLDVLERGLGKRGVLLFAARAIPRAVAQAMAEAFVQVLEDMVRDPAGRVGRLDVVGPAARRRLLAHGQAERTDHDRDQCLHHLFEAQARRTPEAVALATCDTRLSYAALDRRADELAAVLRARRVGPDTRVGVCLSRDIPMIVAVLGILKAGGAYVPLDPAYPRDRLRYMMSDARMPVVITSAGQLDRLAGSASALLCLDASGAVETADGTPADAPATARTRSAHMAYCLYTSGSTGRPKAVGLAHANAVAFVAWGLARYRREALACVAFTTTLNFDLSIFELFVPLSCGGTVRIYTNALSVAGTAEPLTLLNTVPSALAALMDLGGLPEGLSVVNVCGEPMPRELCDRIYRQLPGVQLHNLYGPTEFTTYATELLVDPDPAQPVTIGRPMRNTRVYLLDDRQALVPEGVLGEICIAGDGLARGYLGQSALTAERFAPDPFGPAGSRMYRTGDLGRWRGDGQLEFHGRMDHQVKIRGFRVELGEIEESIRRHDAVRDVVVLARPAQGGLQRLVAYLVPHALAELDIDAIRCGLQERLPDYMVPTGWMRLDAMPLTPNGKTDRQALPEAPQSTPASAATPDATGPAAGLRNDAFEALVSEVWSTALGVRRLARTDNFFDVGGHSLVATQILAALARKGVQGVQLRHVFDHPTVAEFADALRPRTAPAAVAG